MVYLDTDAPLAPNTHSGQTVWAALCDIRRTIDGDIYLRRVNSLNTVTDVIMQSRTRPATPSLILDARADLNGVPGFVRDTSNTYGQVTANGPALNITQSNAYAQTLVGNATDTETVEWANANDLAAFAQARIDRGIRMSQLPSIAVDAETSSVTVAQLAALELGDRISIVNLPLAQLGITSWDGWIVGINITQIPAGSNTYTFYLEPAFPQSIDATFPVPIEQEADEGTPFAVSGTSDRTSPNWGLDGFEVVTPSPATGTTLKVQVTASEYFSQTSTFKVQACSGMQAGSFNREVLQVTAATAPVTDPTYGYVQTITVTRAVNGVGPIDLAGAPLQVYAKPVLTF